MNWQIPAKTFLLGEYAALAQGSAIILTTTPCFELSLNSAEGSNTIHPDSPAGLWLKHQAIPQTNLTWFDPYQGRGGLGASSAQFLASYLASCHLHNKTVVMQEMLTAYYQCAWSGVGLKPSGYDVIAQSHTGCVFINKQKDIIESYPWPFKDLSFLLIHTGIKLATHEHLKETTLPQAADSLSNLVDEARNAFKQTNSQQLIASINAYHRKLTELGLIAEHSLDYINALKQWPEIVAIKGCGALGADVLLLVCARKDREILSQKLQTQRWLLLATEENLKINEENT